MATATYTSGVFSGGSSTDRLTIDDLADASGSPFDGLLHQVANIESPGEHFLSLDSSSFIDLTGALLILRNASNNQALQLLLEGDTLVRSSLSVGEIRDRDFLMITGPYDFSSTHTEELDVFDLDAKIVCQGDSRIVIHNVHTETGYSTEPGARVAFRFRNNNADSRIKIGIHSGPATDHGWAIQSGEKPNGTEIVHWDIRSNVTVREIDWRTGYIDFRPDNTSAAPTKGTFVSSSGVKFLGTGYSFTNTAPLIYGNAADAFAVTQASDRYWLFGIVGADGDFRIVTVNLAGPDLATRFAMYTQSASRTGRFENHLVLDYKITDSAGAGIEDVNVRVHARTPEYSAPSGTGSASVTFPTGNAIVLETSSDADGEGAIGTADGDLTTALCIEAFGRRIQTTGGDVDGNYASASNARADYASHVALTYDIFRFGYEPVVGTSFTAKKSGETGTRKTRTRHDCPDH